MDGCESESKTAVLLSVFQVQISRGSSKVGARGDFGVVHSLIIRHFTSLVPTSNIMAKEHREVEYSSELLDEENPIPGSGSAVLSSSELWWIERYEMLKDQGYTLRPRFRPGWVPTWKVRNIRPLRCEDSIRNPVFVAQFLGTRAVLSYLISRSAL